MIYQFLISFLCIFCGGIYMDATETPGREGVQHIIILMGPPASGKGTQAVRLSKSLELPHISTGDLLRENISKKTDLGLEAKGYMDGGKLVPDQLVLNMLFDRVARKDAHKGYILDGFPRTLAQADALSIKLGQKADVLALNLEVSDETIIKRTAGRQTCASCGAITNKFFAPSKEEGKCDLCGGNMFQRPDDRAEVVQERLKAYHVQTAPLIDYYRQKGVLQSVNGERSPDEVFVDLLDRARRFVQKDTP